MKFFFHRQFESEITHSAQYASRRIESLLLSDRLSCIPGIQDELLKDLIRTASHYLLLEKEKITIHIEGEPPVLYIQIPILDKR